MGGAVNPVAMDAVRERLAGTYGSAMTLTMAPTFTGKIVFSDPVLNKLREKAQAVKDTVFEGNQEWVRDFAESEGDGGWVDDLYTPGARAISQLLLAIEEMFSGF